jgi:hypothetical protein
MSGLTITVVAVCVLAGVVAAIAIVQWMRQRAALAREVERLRKFEEDVAALKAFLEPSQAWKDKQAAEDARRAHLKGN